jgi:hypothetical protein
MQNIHFETKDSYQEAFQAFSQQGLFDRLQDKYKVRPYFQRYALTRSVVLVLTYFLNVFSMLTAFAFVFTLLAALLPAVVAGVLAVVLLAFIEALKRLTVPSFFKTFFQFRRTDPAVAVVIILLAAASCFLSFQGAKDIVRYLSNDQDVTKIDDVKQSYLDQMTKIDQDKKSVLKQTWKGKLTSEASEQMTSLLLAEDKVRSAMLAAVQDAENTNKEKALQHEQHTQIKSEYFAVIALLLDLSLIFCLYFLEWYDFRSLAEFVGKTGQMTKQMTKKENLSNDQVNDQDVTKFPLNGQQRPTVKGFAGSSNETHYNAATTATCLQCGRSFLMKTSWQKFCSADCRLLHHAAKHGGTAFKPALYFSRKL